jgi:hypothetical protein
MSDGPHLFSRGLWLEEFLRWIGVTRAHAMSSVLARLMNFAMPIEREQLLQVESHQRTTYRQGYANGVEPKTL